MAGKGKGINPQDMVNAWNILNVNNWFSISHIEDPIGDDGDRLVPPNKTNKFQFETASFAGEELILHASTNPYYVPQDTFAFRKAEFEKLSDMAKEIINTVCFGAPEVITQLESRKRIKENKVFKYFKKKWGGGVARKAISEVRCFSSLLK